MPDLSESNWRNRFCGESEAVRRLCHGTTVMGWRLPRRPPLPPPAYRGKVGLGPVAVSLSAHISNPPPRTLSQPLSHTVARALFLSPPCHSQDHPLARAPPHPCFGLGCLLRVTYSPLLQLVPEHPEFTEVQLPVACGLATWVKGTTKAFCGIPGLVTCVCGRGAV